MAFSTYMGNALLNMILKNTDFAELATTYASLHSADPGVTGTSELTGNGYARKSIASTDWGTVASKTVANANIISFAQASGAWTTATYVGLWDAVSGGNFLGYGALTVPVTVGSGGVAQFAVGALTATAV